MIDSDAEQDKNHSGVEWSKKLYMPSNRDVHMPSYTEFKLCWVTQIPIGAEHYEVKRS